MLDQRAIRVLQALVVALEKEGLSIDTCGCCQGLVLYDPALCKERERVQYSDAVLVSDITHEESRLVCSREDEDGNWWRIDVWPDGEWHEERS